jgi:hypothetical protein
MIPLGLEGNMVIITNVLYAHSSKRFILFFAFIGNVSYYPNHTAAISYNEAQSRCEKSGYNLASFTSQTEIGQMKTVMTDTNWEYWTGLKYTKSTEPWKFTDGTDTQFASRLLSTTDTNSQCVLIRGDGTLLATHCDGDRKYICCRVDQDHPRTVPPTSSG